MAIYQFVKPDGTVVERHYPMSKAPDIGTKIIVDGVPAVRIISTTKPFDATAYDTNAYPKVCSTLPVFAEGAEHVVGGKHHGKAIILSRHHQDEMCRRHGYTRDHDHKDMDYIEKEEAHARSELAYVPWDR